MGLKMGAGSSTAGAGELQVISIIASSAPGLSPLTRGTPDYLLFQSSHRRFIPAGAGNTIVFAPVSLSRSVYPRWRGEHMSSALTAIFAVGLSPLARGTRVCQRVALSSTRFIPAGAGNTIFLPRLAPGKTVYPRWRGEHYPVPASGFTDGGLSPLARGTLPV